MFEDLRNKNIIVDLKMLLDKSEKDNQPEDEDLEAYCGLMKELIMSTSGIN